MAAEISSLVKGRENSVTWCRMEVLRYFSCRLVNIVCCRSFGCLEVAVICDATAFGVIWVVCLLESLVPPNLRRRDQACRLEVLKSSDSTVSVHFSRRASSRLCINSSAISWLPLSRNSWYSCSLVSLHPGTYSFR